MCIQMDVSESGYTFNMSNSDSDRHLTGSQNVPKNAGLNAHTITVEHIQLYYDCLTHKCREVSSIEVPELPPWWLIFKAQYPATVHM